MLAMLKMVLEQRCPNRYWVLGWVMGISILKSNTYPIPNTDFDTSILESRNYDFWTNLAKTKYDDFFDDCKHIWSLLKVIASIYSPIQV